MKFVITTGTVREAENTLTVLTNHGLFPNVEMTSSLTLRFASLVENAALTMAILSTHTESGKL